MTDREPIRVGPITIDPRRYKVYKAENDDRKIVKLPKKEFELLSLLAKNPGIVFTRKDLIEEIWDGLLDEKTRTVDAHIGKLRRKVGKELIETVTGVGYRMREESK